MAGQTTCHLKDKYRDGAGSADEAESHRIHHILVNLVNLLAELVDIAAEAVEVAINIFDEVYHCDFL